MKSTVAILLGALAAISVSAAAKAETINATGEVLDTWYSHSNDAPNYAHTLTDFNSFTKNTKVKTGTTFHQTNGSSLTATVTSANDAWITQGSGNSHTLGFTPSAPYHDTSNYLAIGPGGSLTFTLSQPAHYFGFEWGSVDTSDLVQFYDGNKLLASFDGADLPSHSGNTGSLGTYFANFTSNFPITKIVLSTGKDCSNPFEIDGMQISTVPVPAALPLFGAAVAGLGAMGRRRRKGSGMSKAAALA
jgi:hypothetical protein